MAKLQQGVDGRGLAQLQQCVDEFGRALIVPTKLFSLHTRTSGDWAALNPAVVLLITSAFEGFAQNFLASALLADGHSLGNVAHVVGQWNNPTLKDLQDKLEQSFPGMSTHLSSTTLRVLKPPALGKTLHLAEDIGWDQALRDSKAWMQVRHCLSHGVVTGWRTERWPASVESRDARQQPRRIMYTNRHGLQSVNLQGARSCASIYVCGARALADAVAGQLGATLDWRPIQPLLDAASGVRGATTPVG